MRQQLESGCVCVIVKEWLTHDLSIPFVSFVIAQKCHQHTAVKFENDHVVLLMERFLHQMFPFSPRPLNRSLHICNEKYPAHFVCCSFSGAEFHFQRYLFWRVLFKWSRLNLLRKDQWLYEREDYWVWSFPMSELLDFL